MASPPAPWDTLAPARGTCRRQLWQGPCGKLDLVRGWSSGSSGPCATSWQAVVGGGGVAGRPHGPGRLRGALGRGVPPGPAAAAAALEVAARAHASAARLAG